MDAKSKKPDWEIPSDKELRGDYSKIRADWTIDQGWTSYGEDEHARWRTLYERQMAQLPGFAAPDYLEAVKALECGNGIPRFEDANEKLMAATGWTLVAVPGLVPNDVFFDHMANRRFPVTNWLRRADEMDYLVEPDIFHDFFGHVPMLMIPAFADFLQMYGQKGPQATEADALKRLSRLYWYMVEFGLVNTPDGLRIYGAGILSSRGETVFSLESAKPNRVGFDLERVMRTDYRIDDFQQTYFVLDSFEQLFDACKVDFGPLYARLDQLADFRPTQIAPGDQIFHKGSVASAA